jgi:hypothetical protein
MRVLRVLFANLMAAGAAGENGRALDVWHQIWIGDLDQGDTTGSDHGDRFAREFPLLQVRTR